MSDEFYIGWEDKAPRGTARRVIISVAVLLLASVSLAALLASRQRLINSSAFEWGNVKEFSGVLVSRPYPHLLVRRPGLTGSQVSFSSYYLVKPFKFGFAPEEVRSFQDVAVSLKGTLIYRDNQTMIEVAPGSIKALPASQVARDKTPNPMLLGQQTLEGEIVDSKCYLGVMNPGQLIPHRGCAIRCISGGIPPLLLVRQPNGGLLQLLLVGQDGSAVNKQVLQYVGEPVRITGQVLRQSDLLILQADPSTYERLPSSFANN